MNNEQKAAWYRLRNNHPETISESEIELVDHISALESRLAAATERARIIEEMYDQEYGLEHGTVAKQLNQAQAAYERGSEMMECGHPNAYWMLVEDGLHGNYICTLCASIAAAYERGKMDAAEHQPIYNYNGDPESCIAPHCNWDRRNDQPRNEWLQHILALKDRGAKGDGE